MNIREADLSHDFMIPLGQPTLSPGLKGSAGLGGTDVSNELMIP